MLVQERKVIERLYLRPKDRGLILDGLLKRISFENELQHGVIHDEVKYLCIGYFFFLELLLQS
jgi:hypothetical protein